MRASEQKPRGVISKIKLENFMCHKCVIDTDVC